METLSKNELKVLNLFRKELFLKSSIRKVMNRIKSKSYQRVYESINNLIKKNMLNSEKIGNTNLISLKLSRETILTLSYLDEKEGINIPNYLKIIEIKEILDYLILATGSYARGDYTKKSDLDLVIIIPNKENVVNIQKLVENITILFVPEIHLYVFTKKDFIEMLKDKKDNYGKEIVKNRIILKNANIFYELIKEAIEKEYKG